MFTLSKTFPFEAAHRLMHHDGKCRRLHGHSWKMTVEVQGSCLVPSGPKAGMLIDYSDITDAVSPMLEEYLDHHYLNITLDMDDPTSECIAVWVYSHLKNKLPLLTAVTIEETCTCRCEYRPAAFPQPPID